ncbi:MAG: hypothetical protein ACLTBV_18140 [Enterocloster bolteae]
MAKSGTEVVQQRRRPQARMGSTADTEGDGRLPMQGAGSRRRNRIIKAVIAWAVCILLSGADCSGNIPAGGIT